MADVFIDGQALGRACSRDPELVGPLRDFASDIAARATALGSGFETERTIRHETGERVGGQSPQYRADARVGRNGPVGAVAAHG